MERKRQNKLLYLDNEISQVEDVVLRCFFPEAEEMTIAKIQRRSGYSYERVNTALKKLKEKGIVSSKNIGRTLVYIADYRNLYLKQGFYHYMTERLIDFSKKYPVLYKSLKNVSE